MKYKILYAALNHDPTDPDASSGVDYNFYQSFLREGFDVTIAGPFSNPDPALERVIRRIYQRLTKKKYPKWGVYKSWLTGYELNRLERKIQPDIVFSIFPPPLAFYTGKTPMVFRTDTTFQSVEEVGGIYGGYGRLALKFQMWMESRAINKSVKILVPGQWTRDQIIEKYAVDSNKIFTYIEPSGLPLNVIPSLPIQKESLTTPLKLLLVGRNYYGKGVDVAIQIVKQLNLRGIPADMIICGCSGESTEHVKFVGTYRKSVPKELHEYVSLYQWAQLLIHPTRYESSGVVPAEAAAFSVPTITNNAGGVSSVVQDGVTGIVLPYDSPAESYVEQIISLLNTPQMYLALCSGARSAYDNEQNWSVVGKRVSELLRQIIVKSKD